MHTILNIKKNQKSEEKKKKKVIFEIIYFLYPEIPNAENS